MAVRGAKSLSRTWLLAGCVLFLAGCTWLEDLPLPLSGFSTATPEPIPVASPTPFTTESVVLPTPTDPATSGTGASQGPRTLALQLWVPDFLNPDAGNAAGDVLSAQVDSFVTVTTDVQVQVVVKSDTGAGGLYSLISTAYAVAPSILPDVVVMNQHDIIAAADAGLVQSLSAALPADAGFFPTALSAVTTQTGVWAFPYVGKAEHMAYSTVADPEAITTTLPFSWTSVISGSYQMLFPAGSADGQAGDTLLAIYLGSGGRVMDQNGQATLDRSSLERVYGFFDAMRDNGLLNVEVALALPDAAACWALFQNGEGQLSPVPAGLFWRSIGEEQSVAGNPPALALGRQVLPSWAPTASGDPIIILKVWGLSVVTQDPARREAALGLVRWLVSAQHMADLTYAAALVPTRGPALEAWPLESKGLGILNDLLTNSVSALPPAVDSAVRRALQAGLAALLQQDVDSPEAAASQALTALRR
jgi:ABC-type glycerol-3-phosphate transport system substrate-binding protein